VPSPTTVGVAKAVAVAAGIGVEVGVPIMVGVASGVAVANSCGAAVGVPGPGVGVPDKLDGSSSGIVSIFMSSSTILKSSDVLLSGIAVSEAEPSCLISCSVSIGVISTLLGVSGTPSLSIVCSSLEPPPHATNTIKATIKPAYARAPINGFIFMLIIEIVLIFFKFYFHRNNFFAIN